ncbi:MAG: ATP-binding domain-containing protein [Armatimonadetes bacterium]|nr:ATP-binding domain-containing protein [Armatimonadota bacterium]
MKPMFLMYNVVLSNYTTSAAKELGLDSEVKTFHSFMAGFYRLHFRRNAPQLQPYVFDWRVIYDDLNRNAIGGESGLHLIVDEGQDLPREFYLVARLLSSSVTVFADGNQTITDTSSTIDQIRAGINVDPMHWYRLTKNFRNTLEIARFAAAFCNNPDDVPALPTKRGEPPLLERHDKLNTSVERILAWVRSNPSDSVGVFCFRKGTQQKMVNRLRARLPQDSSVQHYPNEGRTTSIDFEQDGVFIFNVQSAKGIEFDTVFVVELQEARVGGDESKTNAQLYVACTRARQRLFLYYTGENRPPIVDRFPLELLEVSE